MKRLALPLIAVGILAACGGADEGITQPVAAATPTTRPTTPEGSAAPATTAAAATATVVDNQPSSVPTNVPEALEFAAPLVGGGEIELTTLAGRPVLLWFWAPW